MSKKINHIEMNRAKDGVEVIYKSQINTYTYIHKVVRLAVLETLEVHAECNKTWEKIKASKDF